MTNDRGLRTGRRLHRAELPQGDPDDVEVEIIQQMEGTGRGHVFPRDGGLHTERHLPLAGEVADGEPEGLGARVAPTEKAEERERERHERQRQLGYVPAGTEGRLRQERGPEATRDALDRAAAEADARVSARDRSPGRAPGAGEDGRRSWARRHARTIAGAGGAVLVLLLFGGLLRRR